jgi:hypothetical protein
LLQRVHMWICIPPLRSEPFISSGSWGEHYGNVAAIGTGFFPG